MSTIATNLRGMSPIEKVTKGTVIISMETDNPNVPGNAEILAEFAAVQAALKEAVAARESARTAARLATFRQAEAELAWNRQLALLAAFTQAATGGVEAKILSAGFDVRAEGSRASELGVVEDVTVRFNGTPGHAKVSWRALRGAKGYLVQGSADPSAETGWTEPVISTRTSLDANGAEPGQPYWYRVAAFNATGQGPWSMPAPRPVM